MNSRNINVEIPRIKPRRLPAKNITSRDVFQGVPVGIKTKKKSNKANDQADDDYLRLGHRTS
ncbi:MAG: hypothetical protein COY81_01430 [Candidatus Pacebacteria bacterium CG_4_10_14_0_8_um_filter_43_12]|nr:MAG: hypothetical protein COY81_01430 [Candidatus Pacebacteria bacterium CG_4_10_14_0_8_um_filter_43_12]